MTNKIKTIFLANSIFLFFVVSAMIYNAPQTHQIVAANSLKEAMSYLDKADDTTLVLLDVDNTLTIPQDPYLRSAAIKQYRAIYDQTIKTLSKVQEHMFNHLFYVNNPSELIEKNWPEVIKDLQLRGVKVLGCTAAGTLKIGSGLRFPEIRYEELKRLGIDFSAIFPGQEFFDNLCDIDGSKSGIEKGIIYTGNKHLKGDFLKVILHSLNWTPQKIILIDDRKDQSESFIEVLTQGNSPIKFIGINFLKINTIQAGYLNEELFRQKLTNIAEQAIRLCAIKKQSIKV